MATQQKSLLTSALWDHPGGHGVLVSLGGQLCHHFTVQRVVPSLANKLAPLRTTGLAAALPRVLHAAELNLDGLDV